MTRTLAVRLDSAGDLLVTGPAIRALAHTSDEVVLLAGPLGAGIADLLPGVADLLTWRCPWIDPQPEPVDPGTLTTLVASLTALHVDRAVIFTSFHQSPLPTALVLRMAGIPWVAAISEDYPGALLDVRHRVDDNLPEPERALSLARAAGFVLPPGESPALRVRRPLPDVSELLAPLGKAPYVVVHPGTSVPARAWPDRRCAEAVACLAGAGWAVVVTGSAAEQDLTSRVAGRHGLDLGGRTTWAQAAGVVAGAAAVVVGNTGMAHLAAATGTPVVSLFAPTVPAERWAPYRVSCVVLGDQDAPCAGTRATTCPVPGHPCLADVTAAEVSRAVHELVGAS